MLNFWLFLSLLISSFLTENDVFCEKTSQDLDEDISRLPVLQKNSGKIIQRKANEKYLMKIVFQTYLSSQSAHDVRTTLLQRYYNV